LSAPTHRTAGFSLLELTIALFLGGLLSAGAVHLYGVVKRISQRQEALMHLQETLQTTLMLMGKAIHSAGNMGCVKWEEASTRIISKDYKLEHLGLSNHKSIQVTHAEALKTNDFIPASLIKEIKPNTDVLWVVTSVPEEGKIKILSDCTQVEIVGPHQPCLNCRTLLSTLYYVNHKNNLYFRELTKKSQGELEGVEDLKITMIPGGVRIKFTFVHLDERLEWEREWAIR
jgi:prepilin-type N-terminal cleavage/methylation domain-containing protein